MGGYFQLDSITIGRSRHCDS